MSGQDRPCVFDGSSPVVRQFLFTKARVACVSGETGPEKPEATWCVILALGTATGTL